MIGSPQQPKAAVDGWFYMMVRSSPAPATVLVVEDEALVRGCAVDALSECGFHVLQAASAPAAIVLLEAAHVDAVFTDINMPGEFDGLGLVRRVRRRWPHIAIVITSGRGRPSRGVEGTHFVPKPYTPDALAPLLDEVISCRGEGGAGSKFSRLAG